MEEPYLRPSDYTEEELKSLSLYIGQKINGYDKAHIVLKAFVEDEENFKNKVTGIWNALSTPMIKLPLLMGYNYGSALVPPIIAWRMKNNK